VPGVRIGQPSWSLTLDDHVSALDVSPDGRHLLAGSLAGDLLIVDVSTGTVEAKLPSHPLGVLDARWSSDGSRLAAGGQDGVLRLCDRAGATQAEHTLGGWVEHVAWSPKGTLAASAGRILTVVGNDGNVHRCEPVSSTITAAAWAGNGTRVGVASYGGLTWFDTDRLPSPTPARRHDFKGSPLALVLSPTGKWACAGYQDSSIHLWPLWSGDDLSMSGYPAKLEHLAFRPDGRWMASACLAEITWWSFAGKGPKGTRPAVGNAHDARISWLGWQPGGQILASGGQDARLVLWPSPTSVNDDVEPLHVIDADSEVATAAWLPSGDGLVVGRRDGSVELRAAR
jgi:WD40 repeat protein